MNRTKCIVGALLVVACATSGCVTLRVPSVSEGNVTKKVTLNLNDCSWDLSGLSLPGNRTRIMDDFLSALGRIARLNMETSENRGVNVVAVKLESKAHGGGAFLTVFSSVVSTAIPPFLFKRNHYVVDVFVSYAIADQSSNVVQQRKLHKTIKSSYYGWSFIRFASRSSAISRALQAVPDLAAEMMVEDIRIRGWEHDNPDIREGLPKQATESAVQKRAQNHLATNSAAQPPQQSAVNAINPAKDSSVAVQPGVRPLSSRTIALTHSYSNVGNATWITEVMAGGEVIKLQDGSLWQVAPMDRIDSSLWLPTTNITVIQGDDPSYPYKLINTEDSETVEARLLSQ